MLRHYFKIGFRSLLKQKLLAFINVFGLSIGIACFILLSSYAINEFSFDRFHKNGKDIYQVYEWRRPVSGNEETSLSTAMPLGPAMKKDIPDVMEYIRLKQPNNESVLKVGDKLQRVLVSFADPGFFSFFSFPLKYGNSASVLGKLNNIVISESKAKELFGNENAIGKEVQIKAQDDFQPFIVSGVAHDVPSNSSIRFEVMASFAFLETTKMGAMFNNWYTTSFRTFVRLNPTSKLAGDQKRLLNFYNTYNPPDEGQAKEKRPRVSYALEPLFAIHTDTSLSDSAGIPATDPETIWIIVAIATGVLIIACINFTTLAIARSAARSTEVGVRKVIGAAKKQLFSSFLLKPYC